MSQLPDDEYDFIEEEIISESDLKMDNDANDANDLIEQINNDKELDENVSDNNKNQNNIVNFNDNNENDNDNFVNKENVNNNKENNRNSKESDINLHIDSNESKNADIEFKAKIIVNPINKSYKIPDDSVNLISKVDKNNTITNNDNKDYRNQTSDGLDNNPKPNKSLTTSPNNINLNSQNNLGYSNSLNNNDNEYENINNTNVNNENNIVYTNKIYDINDKFKNNHAYNEVKYDSLSPSNYKYKNLTYESNYGNTYGNNTGTLNNKNHLNYSYKSLTDMASLSLPSSNSNQPQNNYSSPYKPYSIEYSQDDFKPYSRQYKDDDFKPYSSHSSVINLKKPIEDGYLYKSNEFSKKYSIGNTGISQTGVGINNYAYSANSAISQSNEFLNSEVDERIYVNLTRGVTSINMHSEQNYDNYDDNNYNYNNNNNINNYYTTRYDSQERNFQTRETRETREINSINSTVQNDYSTDKLLKKFKDKVASLSNENDELKRDYMNLETNKNSEIYNLKQAIDKYSSENRNLEEELKFYLEQNEELQQNILNLAKDSDDLTTRLKEESNHNHNTQSLLKERITNLEKQNQEYLNINEELQIKIKNDLDFSYKHSTELNIKINDLENLNERLKKDLQEIEYFMSQSDNEKDKAFNSIKHLNFEKDEYQKKYKNQCELTEEIQKKLELRIRNIESDNREQNYKIQELIRQLTIYETSINLLEDEKGKLLDFSDKENVIFKSELKEVKTENQKYKDKTFYLTQEINKLQQTILLLNNNQEVLEDEVETLKKAKFEGKKILGTKVEEYIEKINKMEIKFSKQEKELKEKIKVLNNKVRHTEIEKIDEIRKYEDLISNLSERLYKLEGNKFNSNNFNVTNTGKIMARPKSSTESINKIIGKTMYKKQVKQKDHEFMDDINTNYVENKDQLVVDKLLKRNFSTKKEKMIKEINEVNKINRKYV